jgi:hypothetical protein
VPPPEFEPQIFPELTINEQINCLTDTMLADLVLEELI